MPVHITNKACKVGRRGGSLYDVGASGVGVSADVPELSGAHEIGLLDVSNGRVSGPVLLSRRDQDRAYTPS